MGTDKLTPDMGLHPTISDLALGSFTQTST
jgi:hypothetical protein